MNMVPQFLAHKAYNLRAWSLRESGYARSGHPTTCLSAADIVSVLFFHVMRYTPDDFQNPDNDRFILSKGHASALLYAVWEEVGILSQEDLKGYRSINSPLEGHPTFRFSHTEAATGSLGIGLSIGVGMALNAKLDNRNYKTYVLMGDSETAEGSVWEAAEIASYYKLDNIIGIVDCNRLGQTTETMLDYHLQRYVDRFTAFGWKTFTVDGHDINALIDVFEQAHKVSGQPVMIIAKTVKGYGIDFAADKNGFHGKAFVGAELDRALESLQKKFPEAAAFESRGTWKPESPESSDPIKRSCKSQTIKLPAVSYKKGERMATREAYGHALAALGDVCDTVVVLDAEVKNSTYAELFEKEHAERFFQCFIAEQNMVSMGVGFDLRGKIPFISTFGCFFTRAHDQIRMAAIGQSKLRLVGSHCGVSIGQDGPSQMALEDIAMMRALPESIVLYPSDAVSTHALVGQMARYSDGISYLRTTRGATPVLYDSNASFKIGGCAVLKQSKKDQVCIIGAGITLHEALKAYDQLQQKEINVSVIDLYCIKPLDVETIISVAQKSGGKIITVEDHYAQGGIGDAVCAALRNHDFVIECLAVHELPRSGKPEELLALYGIDAAAIITMVNKLI
jgi:transketolase